MSPLQDRKRRRRNPPMPWTFNSVLYLSGAFLSFFFPPYHVSPYSLFPLLQLSQLSYKVGAYDTIIQTSIANFSLNPQSSPPPRTSGCLPLGLLP